MRSRMPIYYDEENNIRLHFSANQTHEIMFRYQMIRRSESE